MEEIDCLVCDGDGFIVCDDGTEIQCEECDGTGRVEWAEDELTVQRLGAIGLTTYGGRS